MGKRWGWGWALIDLWIPREESHLLKGGIVPAIPTLPAPSGCLGRYM